MTAPMVAVLEEGMARVRNSVTALEISFASEDISFEDKLKCLARTSATLTQLASVALAFACLDADDECLSELMPKLQRMTLEVKKQIMSQALGSNSNFH